MMNYLISSTLCSGLLFLAYWLFLQNERMYRFNRFYLLFSLIFSLIVPCITIKTTALPVSYQHVAEQVLSDEPSGVAATAPVHTVDTVQQVLIAPVHHGPSLLVMATCLYLLVTGVLLARFLFNLYHISKVISRSEKVIYQDTSIILTRDPVTPHSFLNYIFISRNAYEEGVEQQIICHEQTHVRQLHSLDVIAVELLQVLCWFNPFILLYRRAIQLNHEFLADEAVISRSLDTVAYQYLLLANASQYNSIHLASQFNYQITKKRLIMMTKTTSAFKAAGKQLLMLLAAATALILFSQRTVATVLPKYLPARLLAGALAITKDTIRRVDRVRFPIPSTMRTKYSSTPAPAEVMSEYAEILKRYDIPNGEGSAFDISETDKERLHTLFLQMSKKQQDLQYFRFTKPYKEFPLNLPAKRLAELQQDSRQYGIWVDDKWIKNADLANYKPEDFSRMFMHHISPQGAKKYGYRVHIELVTKKYDAEYNKKTAINGDHIDYWHIQQYRNR